MRIEFYDDYFSIPPFSAEKRDGVFKDEYIRLKLENGRLYKYVAFDDDESLNQRKLEMLQQKQFWVSRYDLFHDKHEVMRPYQCFVVSRKTGKSMNALMNFFSTVNEMYDVACFTYRHSKFMWDEYANNGNGYSMEFEMINSDKFYPVIYLDISKIDYTDEIIRSFNSTSIGDTVHKKLAIQPWVLKNLDFQKEKEIRFLFGDLYDDIEGPMGGRIAPGKKKAMGYKGTECNFGYAGISLKKVVIGPHCIKTKAVEQICKVLAVACEKLVL